MKKRDDEYTTFGFRISEEDLKMIKKHAREKHHLAAGSWIRQLILEHLERCSK